jgi:acyl dehydratase
MAYKAKGQYLDDFRVGDEYTTSSRTVTETDVVNFAGLSGDYNPLHVDEEFAQNTMFKSRIAHGALVYSIATGLSNQLGIFEGTTIAMIGSTQNYVGAVKFGDTVRLVLNTTNKKDTSKPGRGVLTMDYSIINQRDEAVIKGVWNIMMQKRA